MKITLTFDTDVFTAVNIAKLNTIWDVIEDEENLLSNADTHTGGFLEGLCFVLSGIAEHLSKEDTLRFWDVAGFECRETPAVIALMELMLRGLRESQDTTEG